MLNWRTLDEKQNTKNKLYLQNITGDVNLTNTNEKQNTKNKVVLAQHYRRRYTDEH